LAFKSDETTAHVGKWTKEEDNTLKDAVQKPNGEERLASYFRLVSGQTKHQCNKRWHNILGSKSGDTTVRVSKWTKEEDGKLQDAVEKRKGEDWVSISELVPDRTKQQCRNRWQFVLDSKSDETTPRVGKWTTDEDITLKNAVEKHNG
jgi:hypothetical protein